MNRRELLWALAAAAPRPALAAPPSSSATGAGGSAPARASANPFEGMTHVLIPGGATLAELLAQARDGDTIAVMPGRYRGQNGVITQRRLTIRGIGARPVLEAGGAHAEGKGLLVVRQAEDVRIENLEFRGTRVPDGNGAAVRLEHGKVTLQRCAFFDNEMGVLTNNETDIELQVQDCEFGHAPRGGQVLPHLLYAGRIARLQVTGSRFHNGWHGHLIKSRSRENLIESNLLLDGPGGAASYELEFPEGGLAWVVGNVISQSENTDNSTIVSFGAEGSRWPNHGLFMAHNTLVNDRRSGGAVFVRVWQEKLQPQPQLRFVNNLLVGRGETQTPGVDWSVNGNQKVEMDALDAPAVLQFGLAPDSPLRGRGMAPGRVLGRSLAPATEFKLPVGTRRIEPPERWSPGAFQ